MEPKYKRVLVKISGEALAGEQGTGIDMDVTSTVADQIKKLNDSFSGQLAPEIVRTVYFDTVDKEVLVFED